MLLPTECVPSCPTHPSAVYRLLSVRLPLLQLEPPLISLGPLLEAKFDMIAKYKYYTLVAYTKQDSVLAPLAGGKVMLNTIVENEHGHQMNTSKTDSSVEQ